MKRLLLLVVILLVSCARKLPYSGMELSAVHVPPKQLSPSDLMEYDIAYCWTPSEQPVSDPEDLEVDIVLSRADGTVSSVVSTRDLKIYDSPFIDNEQEGNPEGYDLGCFSASGFPIRYSGNELFWKTKGDELAFVAGINPQTVDFRMLAVPEDMAFTENEMPSPYDYATLFSWPRGVIWSPDDQRFAFLGLDSQLQSHGNNIWVYDMVEKEFQRITDFVETGNDVATASWSSDGTKLAIGYGGPESGLGIAEYSGSQRYIEISSRTKSDLLNTWPYWLDSSWINFFRAISEKDSTENFTS